MTLKVGLDASARRQRAVVRSRRETLDSIRRGVKPYSAHEFTASPIVSLSPLYQECLTKVANLVSEGSDLRPPTSARHWTSVRNQYLDDAKARAKFAGVWDPEEKGVT